MSKAEFADVVVHIGYHKAGSTLLQNRVFVPARGMASPWSQDFYHRHIMLDRPDRGWALRVRSAFVPGIESAREAGLVPVLSCEALSGDIWRLGQANGFANFHVAEVLAEAFPGCRVVIVHREQVAMICSLYKHSVRSHWRYSLRSFLDQAPLERGSAPLLNLGYLEYSFLLGHYQSLFGQEDVVATPFELVRDPARWSALWSRALGRAVDETPLEIRENPGFATATGYGKRIANFAIPAAAEPNRTRTGHFLGAAAFQVDARVPDQARRRGDVRLRRAVEHLVGDRFLEDNARLHALINEDWRPLGYRTESA